MFKGLFDALGGISAHAESANIAATKTLALQRASKIDQQTGLSALLGEDPTVVQNHLAATILAKESKTKDNDPFLKSLENTPPMIAAKKSLQYDASASAELLNQPTDLSPGAKQVIGTTASLYIQSMEEHTNLKPSFDKQKDMFKRVLGK